MDIELDLGALTSKQSELAELSSKAQSLVADCNSSSLSKLSGTEISSLGSRLKESMERLEKAYNNSNDWFSRHNSEFTALEDALAAMKGKDGSPEEFKSVFSDLFTKIAVPVLTTQYRKEQKEKNSIAYKKKQFLGAGVDDLSQYTVANNVRNMRKHMRMFDNTTGEEIPEDGNITMKVGETRVITVKLPTDTGAINQIVRTTAADTSNKGSYYGDTYKITSSKSNLTGDPNNIEYVNYKSNHWPSDKSILHNNYYEWIIHADKTGARQISQTCEYSNSAIPGWYAKAMIGLNIKIVD